MRTKNILIVDSRLKKKTYFYIRNCKNENRNTLFIAFLHAHCYLLRKKPIRLLFYCNLMQMKEKLNGFFFHYININN